MRPSQSIYTRRTNSKSRCKHIGVLVSVRVKSAGYNGRYILIKTTNASKIVEKNQCFLVKNIFSEIQSENSIAARF